MKRGLVVVIALVTVCAAGLAFLAMRRDGENSATLMARGRQLAAAGDYRRSLQAFREAARKAPGSLEAHYGLALAMLRTGDAAEAQQELYRVVQRKEDFRDARVQLARVMVRRPSLGDAQDGFKWAEKELAAAPQGAHAADAHYAEAIGLLRHEQGDSALEHLRTAVRLDPAHIDSAVATAMLLLIRGNQPGAEATLLALPSSARSEEALGEFYRLAGRPAVALGHFRNALRLQPDLSVAAVNLCDTLFALHDSTTGCAEPLERLRDAGQPEFRHLHALYLLRNGSPDAGLAELAGIHERYSGDPDARSRWLAALVAMGRAEEAERVLTAMTQSDPRDERALAERGHLRLLRGDRAAAAADIDKAMSIDPQQPEARYEKAFLEYTLGDQTRSEYEIGEATRFDPGFLPARLDWARELIAEGKPALARDVIENTPMERRSVPSVRAARQWTETGSPARLAGKPFEGPGLRPDLIEYPCGPVFQAMDLEILSWAQAPERQRWLMF